MRNRRNVNIYSTNVCMLMDMLSNHPTGKYPKHKKNDKNVTVEISLSEFYITSELSQSTKNVIMRTNDIVDIGQSFRK